MRTNPGTIITYTSHAECICTFAGKLSHLEPARLFEVPIAGPLQEDLGYIP